jgi:branched-chain amino acid transport system permease protein
MIMIFLYGALATAWNIIAGYCGQISLGQAVFFGVGAYTSSLLFKETGLTPWAGMVAGAVLAVIVSQIIGYPVFRLRGHYFAIATIAVGEIVQALVVNWDAIGGARGVFLPIKRPDSLLNFQFHQSKAFYYYIALGLLLLAVGVTRLIERSRRGYYFRAIREDQEAAAALGVNVAREKLRALASFPSRCRSSSVSSRCWGAWAPCGVPSSGRPCSSRSRRARASCSGAPGRPSTSSSTGP